MENLVVLICHDGKINGQMAKILTCPYHVYLYTSHKKGHEKLVRDRKNCFLFLRVLYQRFPSKSDTVRSVKNQCRH